MDKRKRKWRTGVGGGGRLLEARRLDYFKHFGQKGGDYSREAINRKMAIIRGNTLLSIIHNNGQYTLQNVNS